MNASSFRDRFGLDFLGPDSGSSGGGRPIVPKTPPGMEAVLDSYGDQLLSTLKAAPNQTSNLLDIAKASSTRLDVLFPVVQHLASKGLVERVLEDSSGIDTYRLTPAGARGGL